MLTIKQFSPQGIGVGEKVPTKFGEGGQIILFGFSNTQLSRSLSWQTVFQLMKQIFVHQCPPNENSYRFCQSDSNFFGQGSNRGNQVNKSNSPRKEETRGLPTSHSPIQFINDEVKSRAIDFIMEKLHKIGEFNKKLKP